MDFDEEQKKLQAEQDSLAKSAKAAQRAAEQMRKSRRAAWLADCGNAREGAGSYCQYERAWRKADLKGVSENPYYEEELWRFDYALTRARCYMTARQAQERPDAAMANQNKAQSQSLVRSMYWAWAKEQLAGAALEELDGGGLLCSLPELPTNIADFKATTMYRQAAFLRGGDHNLHGSVGCPALLAAGGSAAASAADLAESRLGVCPYCQLSLQSISKVASANVNTKTGFEHWYRKIAQAAADYRSAAKRYLKHGAGSKKQASGIFKAIKQLLKQALGKRLEFELPGSQGVVALALDPNAHRLPEALDSLLSSVSLPGPRVALSGAQMSMDAAEDGDNLLANLVKGLEGRLGSGAAQTAALGVFSGVLKVWASCLLAYNRGVSALSDGLVGFLGSVPLVKATPLARWARSALDGLFDGLGLAPARLDTPKASLVNSQSVLPEDDLLRQAKTLYSALPGSGSGSLQKAALSSFCAGLRSQSDKLISGKFKIMEFKLAGVSIPLQISLPKAAQGYLRGKVEQMVKDLQYNLPTGAGRPLWD
ncbi:MAG: hypothetical protein LBL67_00020 [Coriobacteriales bacterium]|nr:hypothetical protein [Coriobacteriales bacterium]